MSIERFAPNAFAFFLWMLDIQLRSLLVLALAGMTLFLLRRSSAAMRHLTLSIASAALLALPLMALLLPSWSVPNLSLSQVSRNHAVRFPEDAPVETTLGKPQSEFVPSPASSVPESQPAVPVRLQSSIHGTATTRFLSKPDRTLSILGSLGFSLWAAGTATLFLGLVISLIRLRRMAAVSETATTVAPLLLQQFFILSSFVRVRQSIRLLIAPPGLPGLSPMTWGLRSPIVLLPAESSAWPLDRLRPVLLHELAHIQRKDWATEMLTRMVCALYWPNPLVWMLLRRLQKESEHACDDKVLLTGIAPADYAQQLIEIIRGVKAQKESLLASMGAVTMANNSSAENRVRAILATGHSRRPATTRVAAGALVSAVSLLLPLASLHNASAGNQNEKYRSLADTHLAPGSDRFPNGLVAEGLYVSGLQTDGIAAAWDRNGNLLARGLNWRNSRLKVGELNFQIERLKLPGMPAWIDEKTFKNLKDSRAVETEFGVVGVKKQPFVDFDFGPPSSAVNYGNGYFNFTASVSYAPRNAAKVDLYLTTSYGPWQTLGKSSQQAVRTTVAGSDIATLSPPVPRRRGVEAEVAASIPARYLSRDANGRPLWSLRLELLDSAGNAIPRPRIAQYSETPNGSPVCRLRFRFLTSELPLAKVALARLLVRPAQTIYFRNVSTKPVVGH